MGGQCSDRSLPPFPSSGATLAEASWEHEREGSVRDRGPGRRREDGGPAGGNQKSCLARALLTYPRDSKESWSDARSLFWKGSSGYR